MKYQYVKNDCKLHLGCGNVYLNGYVNIDLPFSKYLDDKKIRVDLEADITKLNYPTESIDEIRSHHVFEHFDRITSLCLLIKWYDWLKIGGMLIIETPDFKKCAKYFLFNNDNKNRLKLIRHIFGSNEADWAIHCDGWYKEKFKLFLTSLGFRKVFFRYSKWHGVYSIIVTAKKLPTIKTRGELIQTCNHLLHYSLIDDSDSEKKLMNKWMEQIYSFLK